MNPMWPTIVALGVFVLFGVVIVVAMWRYSYEEAIKIWHAEVGLLGALIGMIGTFFFAQDSISDLRTSRNEARQETQRAVTKQVEIAQEAEFARQERDRWAQQAEVAIAERVQLAKRVDDLQGAQGAIVAAVRMANEDAGRRGAYLTALPQILEHDPELLDKLIQANKRDPTGREMRELLEGYRR